MKKIILYLIRFYQRLLPLRFFLKRIFFLPEHNCRFRPTCSSYAYQSILNYGIMRGGFKALLRFFRCNPFSKGGFDPVK
jgi:uncharacterized protein